MNDLYVALENIRSIYNVGAILRTCSFFGIRKVYLIGYSGKERLPNGVFELSPKLNKTALGSQLDVELILVDSTANFIDMCKADMLNVLALEQTSNSADIYDFRLNTSSVLVVGNEIEGVSDLLLNTATHVLEIPKQGTHNSLNVSVSCGVALGILSCNSITR